MTPEKARARPHVGIVACSAEGAALCYRTFCLEGEAAFGVHGHPDVSLHTHCLADYMVHVRAGAWRGVAELMLSSARRLHAAGAELLMCPDNTIHEAFPLVERESPVPWLHIARVVAGEAKKRGHGRLAILGTKYLMEGPVYREACGALGLGATTPDEATRLEIDRIIFEELVCGRILPASARFLHDVIRDLRGRGCEAVVLGCTELPLIVDPSQAVLPTLDSTRLLARAALAWAVER
jgi:aspartate racemase